MQARAPFTTPNLSEPVLCLERVELSTFASVVQRSIQLSYKHGLFYYTHASV